MPNNVKLGTLVVVVLKAVSMPSSLLLCLVKLMRWRHNATSLLKRNLPNPSMYKQSPYALLRLGGGGKRTQTDQRGGQHPVWDEDVHLEIHAQDKNEPRVLKVGIYVQGKKMDESIGEGEVVIDDVLRDGEFDGMRTSRSGRVLSFQR